MGQSGKTEWVRPAVMAIDPGRAKCGVAVVDSAGDILYRSVVSSNEVSALAAGLAGSFSPEMIVLGDGTAARTIESTLEEIGIKIPICRVDERHTSENARALYLQEHPARGLQRLLPSSLRVPDGPYDDYVAIILARRWWEQKGR
jgi:RNase H-fold protein (predicted Holliday junction resolvase)